MNSLIVRQIFEKWLSITAIQWRTNWGQAQVVVGGSLEFLYTGQLIILAHQPHHFSYFGKKKDTILLKNLAVICFFF
jgi:hypothetical protein